MSTRSNIAMITKDGTVVSTYCHHDGYLDGVGKTLNKHYRDPSKVEELIKLGKAGISSLESEIGEKHPFNDMTHSDWTRFYGRDGGDSSMSYEHFSDIESFKDRSSQYYSYCYDPNLNIWFAFENRKLVYIPGQSKALVDSIWNKITLKTKNESKQFKLAGVVKKMLNEKLSKGGSKDILRQTFGEGGEHQE